MMEIIAAAKKLANEVNEDFDVILAFTVAYSNGEKYIDYDDLKAAYNAGI